MESTPIFQCSVEARELADYLIAQAAKNDCSTILTYEELSAASGCNIREKNGILQTARNIALREARVWYGCVRSLGVRKLDHHEVSAEGEDGRQSILRMSQRKLRRMAVTDFEKLTDEQKVKHNVNASLLGAVHLMNRRSSLKRLEGAVIQSSARIPVSGVLRLFGAQDGEANE